MTNGMIHHTEKCPPIVKVDGKNYITKCNCFHSWVKDEDDVRIQTHLTDYYCPACNYIFWYTTKR